MKKFGLILLSIIIIFGLILTGCKKEPGIDHDNDQDGEIPWEEPSSDYVLHPDYGPWIDPNEPTAGFAVINPYAQINWTTYGQYKAATHVHTLISDGSDTLADMIERHYAQDYDFLAITDHNNPYGPDIADNTFNPDYGNRQREITTNWVLSDDILQISNTGNNVYPVVPSGTYHSNYGITQQRFNQMTALGTGRSGRKMQQIPNTSELRAGGNREEINVFFAPDDFQGWKGWGGQPISYAKIIHDADAIGFINHPGRATDAMSQPITMPYNSLQLESNNPLHINRYVDIFKTYFRIVGFEIVNRADASDSRNDRILWDNVNIRTIQNGRFVWGYANDDSHSTGNVGRSWNVFLMPDNNLNNLRTAMQRGHSFAVAKTAGREGITGTASAVPVITNIEVNGTGTNDASITITATDATKIEWITDRRVVKTDTASSSTFSLSEYMNDINVFVRANVYNAGGVVFTQPFGIKYNGNYVGGDFDDTVYEIKTRDKSSFKFTLGDNFYYGEGYQGLLASSALSFGEVKAGNTYHLEMEFELSRDLEDELQIVLVDDSAGMDYWGELCNWIDITPSVGTSPLKGRTVYTWSGTITAAKPQMAQWKLAFQTKGAGTRGVEGSGVQGPVRMTFTRFIWTNNNSSNDDIITDEPGAIHYPGIIAPPPAVNPNDYVINGNLTNTNGRRELEIDILKLIEGSNIQPSDIYGIEAVTYGLANVDSENGRGNRQLYIIVNDVSSPLFQGSADANVDRICSLNEDGLPTAPRSEGRSRTRLQSFIYMNGFTPSAANVTARGTNAPLETNKSYKYTATAPFISNDSPAFYDVRIRANNNHDIVVTMVRLLAADQSVLGYTVYNDGTDNKNWGDGNVKGIHTKGEWQMFVEGEPTYGYDPRNIRHWDWN